MRYLLLLLVVVFTCFILFNSSLDMSVSGKMSSEAADLISGIANALDIRLDGNVEHSLRKLAHFCEFAILGGLWCCTFAAFHVGNRTATGYILLFCLFTAVADEYVQFFTPGRSSQVRDVLLDFSGAFCAWLAYRVLQWSI